MIKCASQSLVCAIIHTVKFQQTFPHSRQQWLRKPISGITYRNWLVDGGSLTARLKARYADFAVQPVSLKQAKAFVGESALLGLKASQHALIREVLLMGNNQPVVFAHSVLPKASLRGAWNGLSRLGNKSLGATLFTNPQVRRTPLHYKKLPSRHPLLHRVNNRLSAKFDHLWARRSIFSLNCARILVTEIFLPDILK